MSTTYSGKKIIGKSILVALDKDEPRGSVRIISDNAHWGSQCTAQQNADSTEIMIKDFLERHPDIKIPQMKQFITYASGALLNQMTFAHPMHVDDSTILQVMQSYRSESGLSFDLPPLPKSSIRAGSSLLRSKPTSSFILPTEMKYTFPEEHISHESEGEIDEPE